MRNKTLQQLADLQKNPSNIRNICILAHVDHGKTTLADALVASNGIISQRLAGKMRYMDSREDEQVRGITMKSSAISLFHDKEEEQYLINLIDSPGHVDFSSEVSTAVRLCDGAVVLVDVVEGVCPQTNAVLRQSWLENIQPVLVLNKIDRLILELKMSPLEAHIHLQQILEQVNLLTNELYTSDAMEKTSTEADNKLSASTQGSIDPQTYDWTTLEDEEENKNIYFSPDRGNVVFASALDGWGFTISHFADIWSRKLGYSSDVLRKTLWGDFYLNGKTKRIMKGAQSKGKKPLFVQFVLDNIWSVYEAVCITRDKEKVEKIVKSLNLKISPRDVRQNNPRVHLQAITGQWLPVSTAVLSVVVDLLPSPLKMSEERVEKLMCSQTRRFDSLPQETQDLKKDFLRCSPDSEAPVIVFVSKMFPIDKKSLPQNRPRPLSEQELKQRREQARLRHAEKTAQGKENSAPTLAGKKEVQEIPSTSEEKGDSSETSSICSSNGDVAENDAAGKSDDCENDVVFVAFARVFSGTVKKGKRLYVLGPKHDPAKAIEEGEAEVDPSLTVRDLSSTKHITSFVVQDLYLFMGRELEHMDEIPAGNVLGIGGLEDHILKSATVSSTRACPAFTEMYFEASSIVRVAVEPTVAGDMKNVIQGLKLLNQADPCVQVLIQETGEHVIMAAGEVHLQRCLDDLKERYAKVDVNASSPIVPFRETIITPPKVDMVNESIEEQNQLIKMVSPKETEDDDDEVLDKGLVQVTTANRKCIIQIRASPLPQKVTDLLLENPTIIRSLDQYTSARISEKSDLQKGFKMNQATVDALKVLKEKLKKEFENAGKQWAGAVDQIWSFGPRRCGPNILINRIPDYSRPSVWSSIEQTAQQTFQLRSFDSSVVNGFQMATLSGPLCEEPMQGVCFAIEKWDYVNEEIESSHCQRNGLCKTKSNCDRTDFSGDSSHNNFKESSNSLVSHCSNCQKSNSLQGECSEKRTTEVNDSSHISKQKQAAFGPFSGQLMSCLKDGCRKAFRTQPQRLVVAMYKCDIKATADVLGKLYGVLGKRNGYVISDSMKEGTQIFNINAVLPVVESFGFAQDIRKRTSGLASPQLKFSHWEVLDVDPFWVPTTEEEYLHYGEKADSENRARMYKNQVRRRKGLKVDEKIVEHGEKQRTLTKMK